MRKIVTALVINLLAFAVLAPSAFAHGGHATFRTVLTGEQEVPGPGDADAYGRSKIKIYPSENLVCSKIRVFNTSTPTAAHIHRGAGGVSGSVVVPLAIPDENGFGAGCMNVSSTDVQKILDNPSNYYALHRIS